MEASNLQIYWHESQPIYSLCFQSTGTKQHRIRRLVTAGGDNKIRVWQLNFEEQNENKVDTIDFLSSLTQHEQAVNVIRFNSRNDVLATAGDDGQLLLWKRNDSISKEFGVDEEEFAEFKESWYVWKRLRSSSTAGSSEIYDLAWSPDDNYIVTGSMDNSLRIFEVEEGTCVANAADHNHYVQGVVWDPQNEFIFSQSADRSVHVYRIEKTPSGSISGLKLTNKITRGDLPCRKSKDSTELELDNVKSVFLFHNETLPSFFRRLAMSPCGSLLCVPAGIFKNCDSESESGNGNDELANAVYVFTRSYLEKNSNRPAMVIPFLKKPCLVISFNPLYYKLATKTQPYINLPYKLVFAVATSDEVLVFDSETTSPICVIGNLHYTPITDLSWSQDGLMLMVSSTDGFCSYISFKEGTLGSQIGESVVKTANDVKAPEVPPEVLPEVPAKKSASVVNILPVKQKAPEVPAKKSASVVNVLPVKRKVPDSHQSSSNENSIQTANSESVLQGVLARNAVSDVKSEQGKRRVQPTLLMQKKKDV